MTIRLSVLDQAPVPDGVTQSRALANTLDLARNSERFGYHRYWVAEHHAMSSHASSAPEVLVAAIAAATHTIRVGSGGVLLTHYAPFKVAEVFRTISALHADRIDLGIGRSTGADVLEAAALNPTPALLRPSIDEQVSLLRGILTDTLPADHPLADARATPTEAIPPQLWLLGSSIASAIAAAGAKIDYAFAHFINPGATADAIASYRRGRPSASPIVAINAVVADTEQEAQRLYATQRAVRNRIVHNNTGPIPDPEHALAELANTGDVLAKETFQWPRYFAGTPNRVADIMHHLADTVGIEEFIIVTTIHDHDARVRSYELLANQFALTPNRSARTS